MTHLDRAVLDIFCTAIEDGVTYWCDVTDYAWTAADKAGDLTLAYADLAPCDTEDVVRVTPEAVKKGLEAIAATTAPYYEPNFARTQNATVPFLTASVARRVRELLADPEGADPLDAGDADSVLQIGLYGEVRYG